MQGPLSQDQSPPILCCRTIGETCLRSPARVDRPISRARPAFQNPLHCTDERPRCSCSCSLRSADSHRIPRQRHGLIPSRGRLAPCTRHRCIDSPIPFLPQPRGNHVLQVQVDRRDLLAFEELARLAIHDVRLQNCFGGVRFGSLPSLHPRSNRVEDWAVFRFWNPYEVGDVSSPMSIFLQ